MRHATATACRQVTFPAERHRLFGTMLALSMVSTLVSMGIVGIFAHRSFSLSPGMVINPGRGMDVGATWDSVLGMGNAIMAIDVVTCLASAVIYVFIAAVYSRDRCVRGRACEAPRIAACLSLLLLGNRAVVVRWEDQEYPRERRPQEA